MRVKALLVFVGLLSVSACAPDNTHEQNTNPVHAVGETRPVSSAGDAADDAAIWVHPDDPLQSAIIATDKDSGLMVYDLAGNLLEHLPLGEVNNVDLRDGFVLNGEQVTLIAASNRTDNTLLLLTIDPATRRLRLLDDTLIKLELENAYGLCMYHSLSRDRFYVFITSTGDGRVEQWKLLDRAGTIQAQRVRTFTVGSVAEGCVADDRYATLYISEEERGIWRYGAEPWEGDLRLLIDEIGGEGNLKADLEGLGIYWDATGASYLVASNQGSSEFAVYDQANDYTYLGSFTIVSHGAVDGVTVTDGLDLVSADLGPAYPQGMMVVQDHRNTHPSANQNFKLVSWADVARALDLPDPTRQDPTNWSYYPRPS